jgi:predicted Zn-dependent protease
MTIGRAVEAEPYFKTIAQTTKTDDAQIALADYYLMISRVDDARAVLEPLSKTTASFGPASLRLAAIAAAQDNRPAAAALVRAVLARTPKYSPARVMDMRLLLADGKVDEAVTAAAALIKDEPNSSWAAEANFLVGNVHASRDRTEEALESYAEALRIQPQSLAVTLALAQLTAGECR